MIINNPTPPTQSVTVSSVPSPLSVTLGDNADANAPLGANSMLAVLARLQAYDGANFDRVQMRNMTDGVPGTLNSLLAAAQLMGYNGSTMDRVRVDNIGGAGALRITKRGIAYGASFCDSAAQTAGTAKQVFAPASNTNGAIVWRSRLYSLNTTSSTRVGLIAKASAPTGLTDGDVIDCEFSITNTLQAQCEIEPTFIAAGKGLYIYNESAETSRYCAVLYTLL